MTKTLIMSVGGSPGPLEFSIDYHKPENVIFFASKDTEGTITHLIRTFSHIKKTFPIIVENPESLNDCLNKLFEELPKKLKEWSVESADIIVDFTAGTKPMSSALTIVALELGLSSQFSYIGGKERNKDGVGTVIDGTEKAILLKNPWDEMAINEKRKISQYFNSARYSLALELAKETVNKVSEIHKPFFKMLSILIEGYLLWDAFKYKGALDTLYRAENNLQLCCSLLEPSNPCHQLLTHLKENLKFLSKLKDKDESSLILDILSNAKRRAEIEGRYDDAVIRIYRTLEKRAQLELKKYEIDTSNVDIEKIPSSLKREVQEKLNKRKNKIQISQHLAFKVLSELEKNNPKSIGTKYFSVYDNIIRNIEDARNYSILTHGDNTINEERYKEVLKNILEFLEIKEDDIPIFPTLSI